MTNEQINIAIAELCGWTDCVYVESLKLTKGFPPPNNPPIYGTYENGMVQLPNYLNDLNAMHEAEKMLNSEQWVAYGKELSRLGVFPMVHANAKERTEAFLRTFGKWKE
jgi:hypothetical protein